MLSVLREKVFSGGGENKEKKTDQSALSKRNLKKKTQRN